MKNLTANLCEHSRELIRTLNNSLIIVLLIFVLFPIFNIVFAHSEDAELNAELQKGRELVEKLQRGEIGCSNLTDDDFHSIGEYVMEQMVGGSDHLLMNQMMERMHGKEAESLMHINMGKRFSGCYGGGSTSTFPMMGPTMMGPMMNSPMMGYGWWNFSNWQGWNFLTPIFVILGFLWMILIFIIPILILVLLILGILYLIKKLRAEVKNKSNNG